LDTKKDGSRNRKEQENVMDEREHALQEGIIAWPATGGRKN